MDIMELEISCRELHKNLNDLSAGIVSDSFCLLDVREPWEAALAAIPGSRLLPMGDVPSRAHMELNPDAHIVVYCHHGSRSLNVVMWLREQGFPETQSLSGGIDAWSVQIDPAIARY
jgi:rhodanese-related sulfurtransferase